MLIFIDFRLFADYFTLDMSIAVFAAFDFTLRDAFADATPIRHFAAMMPLRCFAEFRRRRYAAITILSLSSLLRRRRYFRFFYATLRHC